MDQNGGKLKSIIVQFTKSDSGILFTENLKYQPQLQQE